VTNSEAKRIANLFNTLPGNIRIGPLDYAVTIVEEPLMIDGSEKVGICHPQYQKIELSAKYMTIPDVLVGTTLHEVLHGIWDVYGLKKKASEEDVVLAFEKGLLGLFKDNPELIDWIRKAIK